MIKITALIPNQPSIDVNKILEAVEAGLNLASAKVKEDFEKTTATWSAKPSFEITSEPFARNVFTSDRVFRWVEQGTKPHLIEPRGAMSAGENARLKFKVPFAPKTQKNVIGSYQGSRGHTVIKPMQVQHPGIQAREFSDTIAREWNSQHRLRDIIQAEINRRLE